MSFSENNANGYFEIAREPSTISFEVFWNKYAVTEQPFIIEDVASDWKAKQCWTENYLQKRLSEEPLAKEAFLWYWMQEDALGGDYITPGIVEKTIDHEGIFPRSQGMRIWVHGKGNISSWHYDANMVNVFNVQVTGRKKWALISPATPLDCYPFTNFAILDGKGDGVFLNKIYTRFTLNEGDMLFLPPLWFHQVEACGQENISLNWVFTKKETQITTKAFKRDFDRYCLAEYFLKHRHEFFRNIIRKINAMLPDYLRVTWQYKEMVKTPYTTNPFRLTLRVLKEISVLAKVLFHVRKIQPYLKKIKSVKRLHGHRY